MGGTVGGMTIETKLLEAPYDLARIVVARAVDEAGRVHSEERQTVPYGSREDFHAIAEKLAEVVRLSTLIP